MGDAKFWNSVKQCFTVVLFVFQFYPVFNFSQFINFGPGTIRCKSIKVMKGTVYDKDTHLPYGESGIWDDTLLLPKKPKQNSGSSEPFVPCYASQALNSKFQYQAWYTVQQMP